MGRPLITVNRLLTMARQGAIQLPTDAIITPAARDFLRDSHTNIQQVDAQPAIPSLPTRYMCGDQRSLLLKALLPAYERDNQKLVFHSCDGQVDKLLAGLSEICSGLSACDQRRGVVLVERVSLVGVVANKYPKVRAASATTSAELFDLMRELDLNLLLLNPVHISHHQIRAMIDLFFGGKTGMCPTIEAALDGLSSRVDEPTPCKCGG